MPSTATPRAAKSLCNLLKLGISLIQGTQYVAQKFTTTTLPDSAARSMLPPSSFDACGSPEGCAGAEAGAAAVTVGAGLFKNARYSAESRVEPGNSASTFSSLSLGSTMA